MHEPSPPPYTPSQSTARVQPPPHLPIPATAPGGGPIPAGPYVPYPQHQHLFGPTPLSAHQLPAPYAYYDPRSPYSMGRADARARERFIAALLWSVAIWCLIGYLIGVEAMAYAKRRLA
ncbi:hypothetical protein LshimejAT787_0109990 [Lyophyllum shimeji]|uniref:Uncharacterized protein n=1 Tax=Lyophyllum shimeji TaxID=47721 RepID=A0A9P3PDM8_LYOSH|nr:hypothetical protein LshimejAT787_0109990 [Lyophyllum shimeji]